MSKRPQEIIRYFAKNMLVVIALVMIWRSAWYMLDYVDIIFFGGAHEVSAVAGMVIGLLILYLPDKDLKEIEKL